MCKPCTFLRLLKQPEQSLVVEATKLHVSGEESKLQVNLTELWYSLCKEDKSLTFQDFRNVDPLVPIQPLFSVWNEVLCVVVGDTRALLYLDSLLLFNSSSCPFLLSHVAQHLPKNRTVEWGHEKLHPRIALLEGLVSGIILLLEKELAELEPQLLHSLEALQTAYDYDQLGILRKCSRDLEVLMKKCDSFYNELENVLQDSKLSFWILGKVEGELNPSFDSEKLEQVEALLEPYLQNIRMIGTRCAHLDKASVDVDQAMMLNFDLVRNRFLGFDLLGTLLSCVITFVSVFVGYFGFNLTIPIYSASKGSQYYWYGIVSISCVVIMISSFVLVRWMRNSGLGI
ncbi:metal ion (Mn2+/Co2+) transporter, MIT family [Galdieria sulphuraria]|uniref:Metal ion (Mn2+/Co2+) transporter, MIT family n=1 Tax=Galdieria sulphuraria TaxID=130081 RepID=M2X7N2_GALSU|nr:metal ion (Mn2+/Co2+) transporter, MIT family [Galdieria sulphuraria]EME32535.1 metal ion (Mn2+/Co2+) transporter, MIT family [Galdieria sulphuraria]|eukprot:XP_005709055.1 metal ion (Mn2+/Co2+) transporter, MIT family [Galdieria sulphuraria]